MEHAIHDRHLWTLVAGAALLGLVLSLLLWLAAAADLSGGAAPRLPLGPLGPGYTFFP